jgi:glucoamylase
MCTVTAVLRARYRCRTPATSGIAAVIAASVCLAAAPAYARERAPGAPGDAAGWAAVDKHGFGTSATRTSRVWFTLRAKQLTEAFYPDLAHPSVRDLTFVVGDQGESAGTATVEQVAGSLTYRQTLETRRWRLTKTYVTDPARATLLVHANLVSLDGKPHRLVATLDPQLFGGGDDDVGWTRGHALLAHDRHIASALATRPAFTRTSSGYAGHIKDLLDHDYDALQPGNVVQAGRTKVTGLAGHRDLTLALGFGARASVALKTARASLDAGFAAVAKSYAAGWAEYRARLKPAPASASPVAAQYETSLLTLKAHEDKANPGAFVAAPSDRVVRARDVYAIATAEIAAGDVAAAGRALDFLLASGHGASRVDGRAKGEDPALDDTALPVVLAWQLGRFDAATWRRVRKAADAIADEGPQSVDRWGAAKGYAPATMAAEIAALVCASDLAVRNGDGTRASAYTRLADEWAKNVEGWTAKQPNPDVLELVRLGIKKADDPFVLGALSDDQPRLFLTGERGEYELAAGRPATAQLAAMAAAANDGGMLPEQPGTRSATPHAWTHAQLVRLAWSIAAGRPIERPGLVSCRYTGVCG